MNVEENAVFLLRVTLETKNLELLNQASGSLYAVQELADLTSQIPFRLAVPVFKGTAVEEVHQHFRHPVEHTDHGIGLQSQIIPIEQSLGRESHHLAIYLLFYVISIFPIVTGRSLDAIVSQVMIPTMLINIYMNLAGLTLPKKHPEQWAQRSITMPLLFYNICCVLGAFCAGVVAFNLFKDLTFNDAVFAVVIVVVMCVLSILRLKQGAVKAEDLAAKKEEIVRQAITDTTADEAEAA